MSGATLKRPSVFMKSEDHRTAVSGSRGVPPRMSYPYEMGEMVVKGSTWNLALMPNATSWTLNVKLVITEEIHRPQRVLPNRLLSSKSTLLNNILSQHKPQENTDPGAGFPVPQKSVEVAKVSKPPRDNQPLAFRRAAKFGWVEIGVDALMSAVNLWVCTSTHFRGTPKGLLAHRSATGSLHSSSIITAGAVDSFDRGFGCSHTW